MASSFLLIFAWFIMHFGQIWSRNNSQFLLIQVNSRDAQPSPILKSTDATKRAANDALQPGRSFAFRSLGTEEKDSNKDKEDEGLDAFHFG